MQCVSPFNESMSSSGGGGAGGDANTSSTSDRDRRSYPAYTSLDSRSHQESMIKAAGSVNNDRTNNTSLNTTMNTSAAAAAAAVVTPRRSGHSGNDDRETPTSLSSTSTSLDMLMQSSNNNNNTTFLGQSHSSRYNYSPTKDLFVEDDTSTSRGGGGATTPSSGSIMTPSSATSFSASRASRAITPTVNNTSYSAVNASGHHHHHNNSHNNNNNSSMASMTMMSTSLLSPRSSFANTTAMTPQSSLMDTMHLVSSSDDNDDEEDEEESSTSSSNHGENHQRERASWRRSTGAMATTTATRSGGQPLRRSAPPQVRQFPSASDNEHATYNNHDNTKYEPVPKYYHPAYWNGRLARTEIYSKRYRPSNPEQDEMTKLEEWLGIPDARKSRNKTVVVQQWMQLHPSPALAASQNSPVSIVLKRGPVAWSSHKECELILLTRGFVVARRVFQYIPRFQLGDVWTNVEKVMPTGMTSFAIVCGAMKTLEFQCATMVDQQAWMNALRVVVLQSYTHSAVASSSSSPSHGGDNEDNPFPEGWQYKLVQTPWFSEAVTGQVRLDSNMLDQMDNRNLNELDSYNQCAPLHYATRFNHVDAMRFLLQAGADPNLTDGLGRTPIQYAKEEELPVSTIELLETYGGKGPNAPKNQKTCFFIPVKDTPRRYRYWTIAILLLLLIGTGLATFLVFYLGIGNDNGSSASSIESAESSPGSADRDTPTETEEEDSSTSTPPPFLVVGVNPIPATNLSTLSPYPTFSSNTAPASTPTVTPTLVNSSSANETNVAADPNEEDLLDESGFNSDEVEETTSNPSPEKDSPSVTTAEPSALSMTSVPTAMPTISATEAATLSPTRTVTTVATSTPTSTVTEVVTSTPTYAATEAATTNVPTGLPTSSPTQGFTFTPTWAPADGVDLNGLVTGPTNFPTFVSLQSQANDFLPEDVLLFEFLVENSLDGGAGLRNPKSAQYKAFRWLSGNMYLKSYSDERKIQRYALATLYFSTNGDEWSNNQYWLSDEDECTVWFSRIAEVASDAICNADKHMITLDLDYNNIQGQLPQEVALLSHLRRMELYGGPQGYITGTLPSHLAFLTSLESLSVRGNSITGAIPSEIGYLGNLENLNLSLNAMSGSIPTTLGWLTKLTSLAMETNRLSGSLPMELGSISSLRSLTSGTNSITGELPTELGLLSDLRGLDLGMNQLSSTLPTEFGLLSNLSLLHLTIAKLQGTIPTQIGGMVSLESLQLRGNALTSSIPSEIGLLLNLQGSMDLSFNELSGGLPSELGNISLLRSLNMNSNQLSGQVPSEIAKLSRLNTLRMELNNFSGSVPNDVCDVFFVTYPMFYADCGTELECSCCTYCCVDEAGCSCEYAGTVNEFLC